MKFKNCRYLGTPASVEGLSISRPDIYSIWFSFIVTKSKSRCESLIFQRLSISLYRTLKFIKILCARQQPHSVVLELEFQKTPERTRFRKQKGERVPKVFHIPTSNKVKNSSAAFNHPDSYNISGISAMHLRDSGATSVSSIPNIPHASREKSLLHLLSLALGRPGLHSAGSLTTQPFVTTGTGHRPCVSRAHRASHKSSLN